MKTIIAIALAVVSSFFSCFAQTYAPDFDLSTASPTEVAKVAQSDAKEFYQQHKSTPLTDSTVMDYASGRALNSFAPCSKPKKARTLNRHRLDSRVGLGEV